MIINIKTGSKRQKYYRSYEYRVCIRCSKDYYTRKDLKQKYCSLKCVRNPLIKVKKEKPMKKQNIIEEPKFVENNLKWAIETYNYCKLKGIVPRGNSDEYGLYKYGEYLVKGERY
jgi:hypothetical protein